MAPGKKRNFVVQMYESEYRQIQAWVDKYPNLETGGDLFGLWADDNTAVVQLVLGPGEQCRRTGASFYQDVDYLERVGNVLTKDEGLCHIGEWHSHHRIGLKQPSGGDENTVWANMERYGIHRCFLFIATIEGSYLRHKRGASDSLPYDVKVRSFLFETDSATDRRKPVIEGKFIFFSDEAQESPYRLHTELANVIKIGAESINLLEAMKKFETTKNQNKLGPNKAGTDSSHTGPQCTYPNKKKCRGKNRKTNQKTHTSTCKIVLKNNHKRD